MAEYIKKEDALKALTLVDCDNARVKMAVADIPAADVVEVVRCKDCKYWIRVGIYGLLCRRGRRSENGNGYCDEGKRREP